MHHAAPPSSPFLPASMLTCGAACLPPCRAGDAGTGKSFLLNQIVAELQTKHGDEFGRLVAVTAATGIAATHINGSTVHSALGCGAPRVTDDFSRMWKKENRGRLRALKANN